MEGIRKVFFAVFLLGTLTLLIWYVLTSPQLRVRYKELPTLLIPSKYLTTKARTHLNVSRVLRNATTSVQKYLYKDSNKSDCQDRLKQKYKPMSTELPLTALASPWRSGNTWIRHLLQMATGIGTTSQYCDTQLKRNGFPYECVKEGLSKFIVKKTHEPTTGQKRPYTVLIKQQFTRAVVIIRDPYTFIVANMYSGHLESKPESAYFTSKFRTVGQPKLIRWWLSFNDYWLNEFKGQVYPVLYTNFLRDTDKELRKVITFLGVEFTDDDIECATLHKEGNFHRKPRVWTRISNIKELFSADMQRQIDDGTSSMTQLLLKKYGVTWVNDTYTVN